jgi:hypothetical protein
VDGGRGRRRARHLHARRARRRRRVRAGAAAGTYDDCIRTEDTDPIGDEVEHKIYCRGVGLVQELLGGSDSLDLAEVS